jgi:hypothetical protein
MTRSEKAFPDRTRAISAQRGMQGRYIKRIVTESVGILLQAGQPGAGKASFEKCGHCGSPHHHSACIFCIRMIHAYEQGLAQSNANQSINKKEMKGVSDEKQG